MFEFEKGVEIVVLKEKERVLANVGSGVHCMGIERSETLRDRERECNM